MDQPTRSGRDGEPDDGSRVSVGRLYDELYSKPSESDAKSVRMAPEQQSEVILDQVLHHLFDDPSFVFDPAAVKENLDEILLVLIAHRSCDTHGKGLMGDLATVFDTRLSPGTVYPRLHDLEEEGLLHVQELVQTKEYRIDDSEEVIGRVRAAMDQHLALGFFFNSALTELESGESDVEFEV